MRPEALHRSTSLLLLLAAAVLFSTGGAAIKAMDLTPWQIASFRSGTAALAVVLFISEARTGWNTRMLPAAGAYSGTLLTFALSTRLTTAANAIFLQSTAPLYLLVIGPLWLKERLRRRDLLFAAAVGAGLILLMARTEPATATAPDPATGNILGASSGVFWALTVASLRWLGRSGGSSLTSIAAGNLLAFLIALPAALPVARISAHDVGVLLYIGVIQIGLAYVCLTRALRHVQAFEAAAVLLVEPALNPVWAWALHDEHPGPLALAGGTVILAAVAAKALAERRSVQNA
jgi:drug/metabolite transporter (DMT)-like permease